MHPARSLLLVPGNSERSLDEAANHPADALILDLEASVARPHKAQARERVRAYLSRAEAKRVWVRVNSVASGLIGDDLAAVFGAGEVEGIVLPKAESAVEVAQADELLSGCERYRGVASGKSAIIVQLDSARAVYFAHEIAAASARIASLCFGGTQDGDLVTDLGCAWSIDGPELMYSRQYALVAARASGIGCPLDGIYANVEDGEGYVRDTELSRSLGYRGRIVVDARQIEAANRIYSPSLAELQYHRQVLETFGTAVAENKASVTLDGKMIDYAHEATARAVIAQARELGIIP